MFSLAALFSLCSCSDKAAKPEGEATELGVSDAEVVEGGETRLLETGKELFESGLYSVARDSFESLRSNFPLSPYLEFAEIKIADTYFLTNEYLEAAAEYENFSKNHPGSENAAYALLMAGRSQHLANRGVGRDVVPLEKARELYDKVLNQHANSPYTEKAKEFKRDLLKDLAAYDRFVIDFYKHKQSKAAVAARRAEYKRKWAGLLKKNEDADSSQEKTSMLSAQADASNKSLDKPVLLAALDKKTSNQRRKTLQAKSTINTQSNIQPEIVFPDLVQRMECKEFDSGIKQVVLYLNADLSNEEFLRSVKTIKADQGKLTLELPQSQNRELIQNCFASKDLKLSEHGVLTLNSSKNAEVTKLSSPERLLLLIE